MPTYAPNLKLVQSQNGLGVTFNVVNATVFGRHRRAQPFFGGIGGAFSGDIVLPDGYIGHEYEVRESGIEPVVVTIDSGSLPPGLSLIQVSPSDWMIQGTPTTVGTYNYVIKGVSVASGVEGVVNEHITINEDPDEGVGAVGGG